MVIMVVSFEKSINLQPLSPLEWPNRSPDINLAIEGARRRGERREATKDILILKEIWGFNQYLREDICFQTWEKLSICDRRVTIAVDQGTPLLSLHLTLLGCRKPGRTLHQRAIFFSPTILCQTLPPTQGVKALWKKPLLTCVRVSVCRRLAQCLLFCRVLTCPKHRAQIHRG